MKLAIIYSKEIKDRFEARHYINFVKIKHILEKCKYVTIREIATLKGGYTPSAHFIEDCTRGIYKNCFPFIKSANIRRSILDLTNLSFIDKEAQKILLKASIVKPFDVLIAMTGTVGAIALVPSIINEANISQNVVRIRIKEEWKSKFSPEYLVMMLNSSFGQIQIQGLLTSTNQKYLNQIEINKIKIPLLGELNEVIKIYKKIYFHEDNAFIKISQAKQIFEEEININHKNIKEKKTYIVNSKELSDILLPKFYYPKYSNTLKELKKKFKTVKLGDIADIKRGDEVGSENYKKYIEKSDSDVPFVRTSDLVNYEIDNYPDYYIDEEIYKELNQDVKEGDILYTKDGKIGLTAIMTKEDKCILASGIARIRIRKDIDTDLNPYYVFLVLSTEIGLYQALQRTVIAATLPHLRPERLAEVEIPLVDPRGQNKISQLVKDAFKLKAEKKKLFHEALTKIEGLLK
jgi:type I restriction enzyme S subunit